MDPCDSSGEHFGRKRQIKAWYVALALMATLTLAIWHQVASQVAPTALRRYISPVLPDGWRMTFLHPSDMQVYPATVPLVGVYLARRSIDWRPIMHLRCPCWVATEYVIAQYQPKTHGAGSAWTGTLVRRDAETNVKSATDTVAHSVEYSDAGGVVRYQLFHYCAAGDLGRFNEFDIQITSSFELLPPGAPVPKP